MSKQYVVVGGSKGIGLAIVKRLVDEGHRVLILSRTADTLAELDVTHIPWDAANEEFPKGEMPSAIHGLVYCPGSLNLRSFKSIKPDVFLADFNINVVGAVKSIQGCLAGLKAAENASVLMFSTVAVGQGMFAHASIAASKGAVEGLARTLAAELSPSIRVNCIAPALTQTSLTERFFSTEEKTAAMGEKYPLGRAGNVADMADASCFLLSDKSEWITGQVLGVDGGMSTLRK